MASILAMGGYAVFVWPAYAVSFVVIALIVVASLGARRRARDAMRRLEDEAEASRDA